MNSTVTALFTKPLAGGWNDPQRSFQLPVPFTAYGSFRNCTRQNHGTAGNHEAGGFVNSAVMLDILQFVSRDMLRHGNVHVAPSLSLTVMKT